METGIDCNQQLVVNGLTALLMVSPLRSGFGAGGQQVLGVGSTTPTA